MKPKFYVSQYRVGQVVALKLRDGSGYAFGEFEGITDDGKKRAKIRFWDFDSSDWWYWDYDISDVRRLTEREIEGRNP